MSSDLPGTLANRDPRFRTLQLTATLSCDGAALARIMERAATEFERRHGASSVRVFTFSGGGTTDASPDGWDHQRWHISWAPPAHWREQVVWPGGQTVVTVVRPDVALWYLSMQRTLYTSAPSGGVAPPGLIDRLRALVRRWPAGAWPAESVRLPSVAERVAQFPLTNPRLPASEWNVTPLGEEVYLGRAAHRMRAIRRPHSAPDVEDGGPSGYWPWLDEYEYLVDDASGIFLRLTGLADGVPVGRITADEVRVDDPIADDVFAFSPPAGTRTVQVARRT